VDRSSAGCAMLGATREELLGRHLSDFAMPEEHHRMAPEIGRYDVAASTPPNGGCGVRVDPR
jgi:hypothetical protein